MRSATVMFMFILSVNASQNELNIPPSKINKFNKERGLTLLSPGSERAYYENRMQREGDAYFREQNVIVENAPASMAKEKFMEFMTYFTKLTKILNLILPGFLTLDKALIMMIVQFLQKGVLIGRDFYGGVANFIILTTNSILLVCQTIMVEEHGEMFYHLHIEKLLPVRISQTFLVIAFPLILEFSRYNFERPQMCEPDFSCSFILFAAFTLSNDIIPAFTQLNFFIPLLIGSFFQHVDREGMCLLMLVNVTALALFPNSVVNISQVVITIVLLLIKLAWAFYSKKKYFDIVSGI